MLSDPNAAVRESSFIVLQELYRFYGEGIVNLLNKSSIRPVQLKEIMDRFENIIVEENVIIIREVEETPKSAKKKPTIDVEKIVQMNAKSTIAPPSLSPTESGFTTGYDIEPININERDLLMEFEQISNILKTSKEDWNARIKAMKTIQSIIAGGAYTYPTFFTAFSSAKESLGKQVCPIFCICICTYSLYVFVVIGFTFHNCQGGM